MKEYLNKVIDEIVSKTIIDFTGNGGEIIPPFSLPAPTRIFFTSIVPDSLIYFPLSLLLPFEKHCNVVYAIKNVKDVSYIRVKYRNIIRDKINNKMV